VAEELRELEAEMREAEARLARGDAAPDLLARYGRNQARFEHLGGYRLRARAEKILAGLGFAEDGFERPLSSFSGGWRMRAALARLLLSEPDLLLLDEPTNHLDIVTLEWLESFLKESPGAFLVVSHDVAFLDRIVSGVLGIEAGAVVRAKGNYSAYVAEKRLRQAHARAAYENELKRRAETEAFAERFRYKATKARQVQARLRQLEKTELPPPPPPERHGLALELPQPPRSGRTVVTLEGVEAGYGAVPVYRDLDFRIDRGEKVVLIGPNGAGKTTLLRLLAGEMVPSRGKLAYGHNVLLSYFAQHQLEQLDPRRTVLEEMASLPGMRSELELRKILGAFLFSGEAVEKRVEVLSGGEKSRLVLAKMLAQPGNFLLMDEPTNHLDIQACEVLKEALARFDGTLCLITHDRDLIDRVATRLGYVEAGRVREYLGNYREFETKRAEEEERLRGAEPPKRPEEPPSGERVGRKEQRRSDAERRSRARQETAPLRAKVDELEARIAACESRSSELDRLLADPATYADPRAAGDLGREQAALSRELEALTEEWEAAAVELEEVERRRAQGDEQPYRVPRSASE
ncbi:MAG: ABC-F family ATP-binding cassette domain-containing protein, partial [Deltaproteobacteria bacterium]|nr:ABC-F family ATP-binding cassette domain-containing protein [Deltaproteobacteria bacterium]